jgi:hypothetical protein
MATPGYHTASLAHSCHRIEQAGAADRDQRADYNQAGEQ